jgi:hypothetical protein
VLYAKQEKKLNRRDSFGAVFAKHDRYVETALRRLLDKISAVAEQYGDIKHEIGDIKKPLRRIPK